MAFIQAKKLAEQQALIDPLTGIKNQRAFLSLPMLSINR
jgi:GGDEF domain-containing protein